MIKQHLEAAKLMALASIKGEVKYLIFHITSACNARCRMCFNWDGMKARGKHSGPSLNDIEKMARSISVLPQLTVSGGEPLLRKDLPQILKAFYDHSGTRFFSVPTNCLLPGRVEETINFFSEHCPDGFLNFCLPFHHAEEERFDYIMGVPGNFSKMREVYEIIQKKKAKQNNLSCVLNFVMSKLNFEDYKSAVDLALQDFSDAPLGIAYARGETHERDAIDVPLETYIEAQKYLNNNKGNKSRFNPFTIMFDVIGEQISSLVCDIENKKITDIGCGAGRHLLVIYDDGSVHPCEMLEVVGMPAPANSSESPPSEPCLGKLEDFDYDLHELLSSPKAKEILNWIQNHECACTWECMLYSKVLHTPSKLVKLCMKTGKYLISPPKD